MARLRSILASGQLRRFAVTGLPGEDREAGDPSAKPWLASRGVTAVVRFKVERFGSDSAPERRAALGEIIKTGRR
jgi:CRISPR-associated protein Csb3